MSADHTAYRVFKKRSNAHYNIILRDIITFHAKRSLVNIESFVQIDKLLSKLRTKIQVCLEAR